MASKWVELKSAQEVRDAQSIAHVFYRDRHAGPLTSFNYALGAENRVMDLWFDEDKNRGWSYRILVEEDE
jgi:hypothetical protein